MAVVEKEGKTMMYKCIACTKETVAKGENAGKTFASTEWQPREVDPFNVDETHKHFFFDTAGTMIGKLFGERSKEADEKAKEADKYRFVNAMPAKMVNVTFDEMFTIKNSRTGVQGSPRNSLNIFSFVSPSTGLLVKSPTEEARRMIEQIGQWVVADNAQAAPSTATPVVVAASVVEPKTDDTEF